MFSTHQSSGVKKFVRKDGRGSSFTISLVMGWELGVMSKFRSANVMVRIS